MKLDGCTKISVYDNGAVLCSCGYGAQLPGWFVPMYPQWQGSSTTTQYIYPGLSQPSTTSTQYSFNFSAISGILGGLGNNPTASASTQAFYGNSAGPIIVGMDDSGFFQLYGMIHYERDAAILQGKGSDDDTP
jgi:hypothetical protein